MITADTMIVEVFDATFADAYAGPDQEWCLPTDFATMDADDLSDPATGIWTIVQGGGVIADVTDPNTEITSIPVGENIYQWTVDNGPCGSTVDVVSIFIYDPDAAVADAGPDQDFCLPTTTTTLAGNTPDVPGVGTWELVQGTATITDVNDPTTDISGLTIGENILTWSIYNGPCADPTIDSVSVFIFDENLEPADAGDDIELCLPLDSTLMAATPPVFPAIGTWTLITGTGDIQAANDPNTLITNLSLGTNTFVWSVDNQPCPDGITQDTVNVFVFTDDFDPAGAGPDQFHCTPTSTIVMDALDPLDPNTGTWTLESGSGIIDDPADPNTEVTSMTVGISEFVWEVYNGPCPTDSSTDTMLVYIYDQNHPPADAGDDQEICLPNNTTILDGSIPIVPAIGTWELIQGSATILDENDPNTAVTDLVLGDNVFVWTIDNGPCENTMTMDTVIVSIFTDDAVLADAGEDIEICTPESCVTLNATPPSAPSVGTWTWVQGSGTIDDINDPNAQVCALPVGHHILQWEIYNGPCKEGNTFDFVDIFVFDANNPPAFAGDDQEHCWPTDNTVLEADPPIFPAIGTWELINGSGVVTDLNDPASTFTDSNIGVNTLTWTVYNGPCADPTIDTVMVTIYDPESPDAYAGEDQSFCTPFGGTNLEGNTPIDPAIGTWSLISGQGDIDQPNIPGTAVNNLGLGQNIFVWSIYNGACPNTLTTDTVSIFVNDATIADANAGPDQLFCGTLDSLQLDGSETIGNTAFGIWTIETGGGDFFDINNEHTFVFDIPLGINTYVWTVDNGACGITSDTVQLINFDPNLDPAFAGPNVEICQDEFTPFELGASEVDVPAYGFWTITDGPVEITDPLDPEALVTELGVIYNPNDIIINTLVWTVDNGVCGTSQDSINIVLDECLWIDVPDAFSPNGDGVNDVFQIPNLWKYPNNSFQVFNRWGALIYESAPYYENWDGRSYHPASFGTELPVSTYYYILDLGNGGDPLTGYIYLKR
ncbi:MAG: gliding motility-associated C-terminal domain-containing protein [Flavobacteriales bacterium]|nr:gliding motility-associated C-terminal domain-containing protein [Rhodothermales bacterium]NNE56312.1 gliding motility-associated C-terminal domain-containing protein [Flavobacteriales bacterium]